VTSPTRQFALLILVPILPGRLEELRALLQTIARETVEVMRGSPPSTQLLPFQDVDGLHYARFVIIDRPAEGASEEPALLAFATDYDGPEGESECPEHRARNVHIDALLELSGATLSRIYQCCEGYIQSDLKRYLKRHSVPSQTFFVGAPGRSCKQILWEAELRRTVSELLDVGQWRDRSPEAIRTTIRGALEERPSYSEGIEQFPAQPDLEPRVTRVAVGLQLAVVVVVIGLFAAGWHTSGAWSVVFYGALALLFLTPLAIAARLRTLEGRDPQFQPEFSGSTHEHLREASTDENLFLQNQLTHFVQRKPGPLRWLLIRGVFRTLQLLATNVFNHGKLGEIPSIHFARWVFTPGRGVLFFSNFDSSWQSYLGDFIDQASSGLTAVWSNTIGYPRTKWLLWAGSRDATRFLAWTRHHQLKTQVWYCAYPGLSIVNINDNTAIRRGLADPGAIDAASWLFRLRSVNRVGADQLYCAEQASAPRLKLADIQGLILRGYGHKPAARYILLRAGEGGQGLLTWLSGLPLTSAAQAPRAAEKSEPFVNVAFSHAGLLALGVDRRLCERFSSAFVQDSHNPYRARVNGDIGESDPEQWRWGSAENPVHILLLLYASSDEAVERWRDHYIAQAQAEGAEVVDVLAGGELHGRKEHFGFRDGIAQPVIAGSGRPEVQGNTVAAGELLLGHKDGYGNVAHSPSTTSGFDFGYNGSYLVFRQLSQDVREFWRYCASQGGTLDAVAVASKMVGRWPSGAPLVRHPEADPEQARFEDQDDFAYLESGHDNDRYGARCPFGSHVRRTNPRDWTLGASREESQRLANLHRIVRRGRPYGPALDPELRPTEMIDAPAQEDEPERGLNFLCFNANIERQFEFIQQQWCNNPNFAGLSSDPDPLIGARYDRSQGVDPPTFTLQTDVKRGVQERCTRLGSFVQVRGSTYFFMPSIPAVRLLASGLPADVHAAELESPPADEQLYIDNSIDTLRERMRRESQYGPTLRGRFAKSHGCVRATLTVVPDLPEELRVGLFREPRVYRAWMRFSSADPQLRSDTRRDIRGVAIKLMDVGGAKLLEGHEGDTTHDLLFASHHVNITADAAETAALVKAESAGRRSILRFFIGPATLRWRAWRTLRASYRRCENPLALVYSSITPYLFGDMAVKYALRPHEPPRSREGDRGPDFLRERLADQLRSGSARFDLMIQPRKHPASMPIEDARIEWSTLMSPMIKVATVELPTQDLSDPRLRGLGEGLTFNPWRALPAHRPLGGINRLRRQAYRALAKFRRDRNAVASVEPHRWELDDDGPSGGPVATGEEPSNESLS